MSREDVVIQMTTYHEHRKERGSIENKGFFNSNMLGDVARVSEQLAIS